MHSDDRFNTDKSSGYQNRYNTTASRSPQQRPIDRTQQYTPTRFTKKPSQRLSQLKKSINQCIQSVSNKKQTNRQALQQVRDVNRQILQHTSNQALGKAQPYFENQYYAHTQNPSRHQKSRQNITLSSFNVGPTSYEPAQINQFQTSQVFRPQSRHNESQDIRTMIYSERARNEELQRQLGQLHREGQLLTESRLGSNLSADNQRLRQQLHRLSSQNNHSIYQEFQRLKEDNQKLRKETVQLLKNGRF